MKHSIKQLISIEGVSNGDFQAAIIEHGLQSLEILTTHHDLTSPLSVHLPNLVSFATGSSFLEHQIHSASAIDADRIRLTDFNDRKSPYVWEMLDHKYFKSVGWPATHGSPFPTSHLADSFGTDLPEAAILKAVDGDEMLSNCWVLPTDLDDSVLQQFIKLDDPNVDRFRAILAEFISKQSAYLHLLKETDVRFTTIHLTIFQQLKNISITDYVVKNIWLLVNAMLEQIAHISELKDIQILLSDLSEQQLTLLTTTQQSKFKKIHDWGEQWLTEYPPDSSHQHSQKTANESPLLIHHNDSELLTLENKRNQLLSHAEALEQVYQYEEAVGYWSQLTLLLPEWDLAQSQYCRSLIRCNQPQRGMAFIDRYRGYNESITLNSFKILAHTALLEMDQAFQLLDQVTLSIKESRLNPTLEELRFLCYFRRWSALKLKCDSVLDWQQHAYIARYLSRISENSLTDQPALEGLKTEYWATARTTHLQWVAEWSILTPQAQEKADTQPDELIITALDSNDLDHVKSSMQRFQKLGVLNTKLKFVAGNDIFELPNDSHLFVILKDIGTWKMKVEAQHSWSNKLSFHDNADFWKEIQTRWHYACMERFRVKVNTSESRLLHLSDQLLSCVPISHASNLKSMLFQRIQVYYIEGKFTSHAP